MNSVEIFQYIFLLVVVGVGFVGFLKVVYKDDSK